ncbi:MAG: hypothetical protein ACI8UO_006465 [Verrucomicrobiales bacterium]|jgi:hypothetical protein
MPHNTTTRRKDPTSASPQPLEAPPDLFVLMALAGVEDFTGSLGAAYKCPICQSRPRDFPYVFGGEKPPELRSLRIFLNIHNEVVVRCHFCGFADTPLALIRAANAEGSWDYLTEQLNERRAFGDYPVPGHWIERACKTELFTDLFRKAKAHFRREYQGSGPDKFKAMRFGEIGTLRGTDLRRIFPEVKLPFRKGGPPARFNVELHRSLLGLPLRAVIRSFKDGESVDVVEFQPPEPISLVVPDWSLYRDWTEEITISTDYVTAVRLQDLAADEPDNAQTPIAWVSGCKRAILDDLPFRRIRYAYGQGPDQNAEFALAFTHGVGRVMAFQLEEYHVEDWPLPKYRVRDEKDAVEAVADQIVEVRDHGASPLAYLNAILDKPWITHATGQLLTRAVATRLGETADGLIAQSGATSHVLPLQTDKAIYLCRNGIYIKARDKNRRDFTPCTNFSLQLLETAIDDEDHPVAHRLQLRIGGENVEFSIGPRELGNGRMLLEAATAAAIRNGLSSLPICPEPKDVRMLPDLVKTTLITTRTIRCSTKLGFNREVFHGPDFTVTPSGIRRVQNQAPGEAGWMLPEGTESFAGSDGDYLRHKANQLSTWIGQLNEEQQTTVGVVLNAAIRWFHLGFQNLTSPLLLPSRQHLDLLGRLLGVVPIEVGRTSKFPKGIPRLMAFPYSRPEQFERQGQIVAAVEAPNRRIDSNIPVVLHRMGKDECAEMPEPESSYLSLIVFSCLGERTPESAARKLTGLIAEFDLRQVLSESLRRGSWYFADREDYLGCFFRAVKRHLGWEQSIIQSRRGPLLPRSVAEDLSDGHGYAFREMRLIEELRMATGQEQPTRFGKEAIPVFLMSEPLTTSALSTKI